MKKILCALLIIILSNIVVINMYSIESETEQTADSVELTYDEDDIFSYPVDVDEFDAETNKRVPLTDTQLMVQRLAIKAGIVLLYCKEYCKIALDYMLNNRIVNYIVHSNCLTCEKHEQ